MFLRVWREFLYSCCLYFQARHQRSGQWPWPWCKALEKSNWFAESRTLWPKTRRSSGEKEIRPSPRSRENTKSEQRGNRDNISTSWQWSWHSFRIIPNTREIHLIPLSPRPRPRPSLFTETIKICVQVTVTNSSSSSSLQDQVCPHCEWPQLWW